MRRLIWPTLRRDGRSPFVLHSFTHALVLAGLLSAQAAARHLCRKRAPPITRRPFHTFVPWKKLFLHRPSSGTLPGIGGSQLSAHFRHVARPSISHVFALEKFFHAQGKPVNFTRRRPFPRRPFILLMFFFWRNSFLHRRSSSTLPRDGHPPAHSFISPRFCFGENFFSPATHKL